MTSADRSYRVRVCLFGERPMALSGVVEFPIPTANSVPVGIAVDSEWVWFAEFSGRNLGRLDPDTGAIEEFAVGEEMCCGVVTGFDSVWFTAHQAGS